MRVIRPSRTRNSREHRRHLAPSSRATCRNPCARHLRRADVQWANFASEPANIVRPASTVSTIGLKLSVLAAHIRLQLCALGCALWRAKTRAAPARDRTKSVKIAHSIRKSAATSLILRLHSPRTRPDWTRTFAARIGKISKWTRTTISLTFNRRPHGFHWRRARMSTLARIRHENNS